MVILTLVKADFRAKNIIRHNEGYFIMIKEPIHQEEINNSKDLWI